MFILFINDLPDRVQSSIKIFANDTKLYAPMKNQSSAVSLQEDINSLLKWSSDWKMPFSANKCVVVYLGKNNPKHDFFMGSSTLQEKVTEKNIGVMIDNKLKFQEQAASAASKATKVLAVMQK